jgi:hypothetical protein
MIARVAFGPGRTTRWLTHSFDVRKGSPVWVYVRGFLCGPAFNVQRSTFNVQRSAFGGAVAQSGHR